MLFSFTENDLTEIAEALEGEAKVDGKLVSIALVDPSSGRTLSLEIRTALELPDDISDRPSNLVTVYAHNSLLQLQNCTGFITSKELGEVIFFARHGGSTSGLVVEKQAGCSLYANVDERLFTKDFTQLPPEVLMSSVALSMSESLFNTDFED